MRAIFKSRKRTVNASTCYQVSGKLCGFLGWPVTGRLVAQRRQYKMSPSRISPGFESRQLRDLSELVSLSESDLLGLSVWSI